MAEGKALARNIQKTIGRTKAKVLQSLGKADKTTDELFKTYVGNFERQQHVATVLQKELKHYLQCVKSMTVAAKSLYETILKEVYEPEWTEQFVLGNGVKSLDMLYASYEAELTERVYGDLLSYLGRFPDFKEKISKRSRKLLDFDNARHEFEAAQGAKKKDDAKISKTRETLAEAKRTYEELNHELHRELPDFYDHRVAFSASNLQSLFRAESTFHLETGKIVEQLVDLTSKLATEFGEGQHRLKITTAGLMRDASIDQQQGLEGGGHSEEGNDYEAVHEDNPVDLSVLSVKSRPDALQVEAEGGSAAAAAGSLASPGGSVKLPQRPPSQPKNRAPSVKAPHVEVAGTSSHASASTAATAEHIYSQLRSPTAPPPPPPSHAEPAASAAAASDSAALPPSSGLRTSAAGPSPPAQPEPDVVVRTQAATAGPVIVSRTSGIDGGGAGSSSGGGSTGSLRAGEPGSAAPLAAGDRSSSSGGTKQQCSSHAEKIDHSSDDQAEAAAAAAAAAAATSVPIDGMRTPDVQAHPPAASETKAATDAVAAVPAGASTSGKPPRQVVATHAYIAEDEDELTFEPGEVITLVPFDDPEEQDEGWEMGIKSSNGAKGVFPANFTRPL